MGPCAKYLTSISDAKSIPPFPIPDTKLLDKLKARVKLAKEIEGVGHKVRKANHEDKWMKEAADVLGVDLSDDDDRFVTNRRQGY